MSARHGDSMSGERIPNEPDIEEEIGSGKNEKGLKFFTGWFSRHRVQSTKNLRSLSEVVSTREVVALIHYVTERGLDPGGEIIRPLHGALANYRQAETVEDRIKWTNEVLVGYSRLCELTYSGSGVNGRTLRDSTLSTWYMSSVIVWGLLFVAAAFSVHFVHYWIGKADGQLEAGSWLHLLVFISETGSIQVAPLFYGGLGACIYLLRSLSKKAEEGTFDARKLQGVGARIFLGAIFGFIVVNLLFDTSGPDGANLLHSFGLHTLEMNAVAFFCGLGVKAIYSIFSKTIDLVHRKIEQIGLPRGE